MKYSSVKIYEDGNCFFRCLSIHIKEQLQTCSRMKNGRCQSRNLFAKETELSNSLRDLILNYIYKNKEKYINENTDGCSIYLEDETLEEHLERMSEDGEFAENLEIKAASDFLKVNIAIWVLNNSNLNKIDEKIGYDDTINLYLTDEEHFDYILFDKNNNVKETKSNLQKKDNLIVQSTHHMKTRSKNTNKAYKY